MKVFRIELDNEFEADVFSSILETEKVPHTVLSHHSLAYDGLFQMTLGWGHIEVPMDYQEKTAELWQEYKNSFDE